MAENSKRKAFLILALAFSLIIAFFALVVAVVNDDELRERLGVTFYIVGFSILGCVLLVLAGYVWDSSLMNRLRTLRSSVPIFAGDAADSRARSRRNHRPGPQHRAHGPSAAKDRGHGRLDLRRPQTRRGHDVPFLTPDGLRKRRPNTAVSDAIGAGRVYFIVGHPRLS